MEPKSRRRKPFASVVVFDTEATGLKRRPKITELCMISVQTDELKSESYPRVFNKLQLCFNPERVIDNSASQITGLYNDALEHMSTFKELVPLVSRFLASQPQPTCLIAHNGLGFDFPLLQAELRGAGLGLSDCGGVDVWCADSLCAFRVLDGLPAKPEWLVQRENGLKKQRQKRQANESAGDVTIDGDANDVSSEDSTSNDSGEVVKATGLKDNKWAEGDQNLRQAALKETSSVARLAVDVNNTSSSECKKIKIGFDSQESVTDSELAEAYDRAVLAYANGTSVLQSQAETTPTKDAAPGQTVADQFVKKKGCPSVNVDERQRATRKLFVTEPASSGNTDILKLGGEKGQDLATASNEICDSAQGSQPEKACAPQQNESVVTSLALTTPDAGKAERTSHIKPNPATRVSYSQVEIYKREFGRYPDIAHAAEDDCVALLRLIVKKAPSFMSFVEDNAVVLSSIEPMY